MRLFKFLLILFLAFTLFAGATRATHAWFGEDLWNKITCITNINCTIRAVSTSALNFITYVSVGEDFSNTGGTMDDVIVGLQNGTWDKGLASAGAKIGGLAYQYASPDLKNYFKTEFSNNLLNNPVEAQVGDTFLNPVYDAWNGMRNLAYGFFTVVMVTLGLGIIFQQQLPSRTVVTFTYALPKILFGLVLITFSYPIISLIVTVAVGFLPPLIIGLIPDVFAPAAQATCSGGMEGCGTATAFSGSLLSVLGYFLASLAATIVDVVAALVTMTIYQIVYLVVIGFLVVRLVMAAGWLFIYTVFSPVIFLFGTLPGQEGAITNFIKQVSAKALVFPVSLFLIALAGFISANSLLSEFQGIFSGSWEEFGLGQYAGLVGSFASIGVLAATISVPGMIENALGVGGKKK